MSNCLLGDCQKRRLRNVRNSNLTQISISFTIKMLLWWLIFSVLLIGHEMPRLNVILAVSVRAFPEEFNIWISKLSKADLPSQHGWTSFNSSKAWIDKKVEKGRAHSLPAGPLEWGPWSSALVPEFAPSDSLVPWSSDSNWITSLASLGLQLAVRLHNYMNQLLIILF